MADSETPNYGGMSEDMFPDSGTSEIQSSVNVLSDKSNQITNTREETDVTSETNGDLNSEPMEEDNGTEETPPMDSELLDNTEEITAGVDGEVDRENDTSKLCQLPLAKIKRIMKTAVVEDTEIKLLSKESIFLVEQATELFIAALAQEAARITTSQKKKTISIQHLTTSIKETETFSFLEGTLIPDYDI